MGQIEDIRAFVQIVNQGSIAKAAEQAGVAKSAMSRRLRLLEERTQSRLISRTTRQWSLTDAGREYYERSVKLIEQFNEFDSHGRNDNIDLRGEIKISVPLYFGKISLSSLLLSFAKDNPSVQLNTEFSDRIVDVIDEQLDLVVRISEMKDSSLVARKLCETKHICCVSPDYACANAPINEPIDLQSHRIIQFGHAKRPKWNFNTTKGKDLTVQLCATLNSHDGEFLIQAAEQGLGVVRVPDFLAKPSVESGKLVQVLGSFAQKPRGIYIIYPTARFLPRHTRALMEYLLDNVANQYEQSSSI